MRKLPRLAQWIIFTMGCFLLLMEVLRVAFILYFKPANSGLDNYLPSFLLGLRFDLRAVSIVGLFSFLVGSIPFLHPFRSQGVARGWKFFFYVLSFVFFFLYTVDFAHESYLGIRLNASILSYVEDAAISAGMVWETYPVVKLTLGIILLSILLGRGIAWKLDWLKQQQEAPRTAKRTRSFGVLFFLVLGFFIFGRLGQYPLRWSDAFGWGNDFAANAALNPFQSFISTLRFRNKTYNETAVKEGYPVMRNYMGVAGLSDSLKYRRMAEGDSTARKPFNIVLIICESFSSYKSSVTGNPLNTTPFFQELTTQGVFFDHCFTPHVGTARGVWATITGIPDVELGTTASRNPSAVDQHTIMNDFKGYDKYYFLGGSTSWANIRGLLANNIAGLHILEQDDFASPKEDVWGVSDKNLFLEANAVFRKQEKPFFAIVQTANNHRPYTIPKEDEKYFSKLDLPSDTLRKYGFQANDELNAFRYMDFCFRTYFDSARKEAYYSNTLFVFVGDHGIGGNATATLPNAFTEQGLSRTHVPLLFYGPGWLPPQYISSVCSQVDVMPTIAGIAGIPYVNSTLGRDLLKENADDSTGTHNRAFWINHDLRQVGILNNHYFYYRYLNNGEEGVVPYRNNTPLPKLLADSLKRSLRKETDAFYHTSGYLLFHNKK